MLRIRQPSTCLQALVAESSEGHTHRTTDIAHHRVNTYFVALDIVIGEIKERFTVDDQDILCALGDVVLSNKPSEDSEDKVANFYELNKDLIEAEKAVFSNFLSQSPYETKKTLEKKLDMILSFVPFRSQPSVRSVVFKG